MFETPPDLSSELPGRTKERIAPASTAPYHLVELPRRVRGLAMPAVELVDMAVERRLRKGIHLISKRLHYLLTNTLEAGHQAIILVNRRGYANYVYCPSCTTVVQCKYCDSTMTYHRSADAHVASGSFEKGLHTGQLHCHYCLAVNALPPACPECGKKLSLFGLGTQRVEEELASQFPNLRFARVDSDTMHSAKDYEALLGRFESGEIQVMLGTQMIAKGLDYPNVTLVGVISGDTALSLPDFRAAERTFQLITQVAGRAGRGDAPGRVILQTFQPNDPTIQAALRQDYVAFAKTELGHRAQVNLPPMSRLVRIVLRDQDANRVHQRAAELAAELGDAIEQLGPGTIQLRGPMPCPISRIAGYHRDQIVLTAATTRPLQKVLASVRTKSGLTKAHQIAVDVDPVSLL
jgi:primosomal protein N' (replication factor Y)